MRRYRLVQTLAVVVALLAAIGPAGTAAAESVEQLIVFGDSISDSGNHFIAFKQVSTRPFVPEPEAPYLIGGFHFSNGPTWVEQLAQKLGIPESGAPALLYPGHFTNYAVGRARARAQAPVFPHFDLATQVSRFLDDFGGQAPSDATYVIWIGSNDIGDFLESLTENDPDGDETILGAAGAAIAGSVQTLALAGARSFLVLNVPNPALTPLLAPFPDAAKLQVQFLTQMYNAGVAGGLGLVQQGLAQAGIEIRILQFDADATVTEIVENPAKFGLTNATDPCLAFGVVVNVICKKSSQHLFWDGLHPTTAAHGILAKQVKQALSE
jgi:phospholipase/lecithinase/hemolysin